jgi:TM2 domain-containing membrane protein YozV
MHCRTCNNEVNEQAIACTGCGVPPLAGKNYCPSCGTATKAEQVMCISCGIGLLGTNSVATNGEPQRVTAFLLAFFLGGLGMHKFYLGYKNQGIIHLLCVIPGIILFGIPTMIIGIVAFIEAIIYITKSDTDFKRIYVDNQKHWF